MRELHLNTSEIVRQVANGDTIIIEKHGAPVAEIRPIDASPRTPGMPDIEAFIESLPEVTDSGRILEQDRT